MGRLCSAEVVHDPLVWVSLLDVSIFEIYNCVAVKECLSAYSVGEDDFLLTVEIHSLNFAICARILGFGSDIGVVIVVVLLWVDDVKLLRIDTASVELLHLLRTYLEIASMTTFFCQGCLLLLQVLVPASLALCWALLSQLLFNSLELEAAVLLLGVSYLSPRLSISSFITTDYGFGSIKGLQLVQAGANIGGDLANLTIDLFFNVLEFLVVIKVGGSVTVLMLKIALVRQLRHGLLQLVNFLHM